MSTTTEDQVVANVRAELERKQMSGAELGRQMGVSQAWVSRRMTGEVSFSLAELRKVADILKTPIDQILGRSDEFWKEP